MEVKVSWNEEHHFVYIETPAEFDIPIWRKANQETLALIEEKKAPVHVVLNMLHNTKHPLNPKDIISNTTWLNHPNLGWTIHITQSNLIRMLARMTIHVLTADYKQAESYEEAVQFLAELDKRSLSKPQG